MPHTDTEFAKELKKAMSEKGEKRCTRCGKTKPLTEFWHNQQQPDGYFRHCKACAKKALGSRGPRARTKNRIVKQLTGKKVKRSGNSRQWYTASFTELVPHTREKKILAYSLEDAIQRISKEHPDSCVHGIVEGK